MNMLIIVALSYLIGLPIIFRLIAFIHKKLITDRQIEKLGRNRSATALKKIPEPIWRTWKERLSFAFKDKRTITKKKSGGAEPNSSGIKRNQIFLGLWFIGLIVSLGTTYTENFKLLPIGFLLFFISMSFGIISSKPILEARKNVLIRMFDIARTKLGQSAEYQPHEVVRVLEWNDYIKPTKAEFDVPTSFNAEMGEDSFMKQFNQIFGQETAWVPSDNKETGEPGWNYEKGIVTIHAVPPLPQMAKWNEHYVLAEGIAWSFFPIAIGVENGVELPNPETGQIENVLGFDLSGEQTKAGKKAGIKVSPTITTSPMVFIGGGTGGGKSLSSDTMIKVFKKDD